LLNKDEKKIYDDIVKSTWGIIEDKRRLLLAKTEKDIQFWENKFVNTDKQLDQLICQLYNLSGDESRANRKKLEPLKRPLSFPL